MRTKNSEKNLANTRNPTTLPELLWLLIATKQGWIGLAGVTAILTTIMLIAMHFMRPDKIDISTAVGSISIKEGSTQNALFSLSPNGGDKTPWVETGIPVKKGDVIQISATGRVNTLLRRLIAETQTPQVDIPISWVEPSGLSHISQEPSLLPDRNNQKLLPDTKSNKYPFGMLLAAVKDSEGQGDIKTEDIKPFIKNDQGNLEFNAKNNGQLVLTVNDILLDENDKDVYAPPLNEENFKYYLQYAHFQAAFIGEDFNSWSKKTEWEKVNEQYQKRRNDWEAIRTNHNWNAWYDDNIGSFLVSITINPETK
jgi:hypothetical protein